MTKSYLRKLYNHTYENNLSLNDYFNIKEAMTDNCLIEYLIVHNPILNYCFQTKLIKSTINDYSGSSYQRQKESAEIIHEFNAQIKVFEITKKKIYLKELEQRKKRQLIRPFAKKHKICDDVCCIILSFF